MRYFKLDFLPNFFAKNNKALKHRAGKPSVSLLSLIVARVAILLLAAFSCIKVAAQVDLESIQAPTVLPWFDDASSLEPAAPGERYRIVKSGATAVGAVILTNEIKPIPAYSGRPIAILVAFDLSAKIMGLTIVEHAEPVLVIGLSDSDLENFTRQYVGKNAKARLRVNAGDRPGYVEIDGLSGATITSMVINRSIVTSVREVVSKFDLSKIGAKVATSAEVANENIVDLKITKSILSSSDETKASVGSLSEVIAAGKASQPQPSATDVPSPQLNTRAAKYEADPFTEDFFYTWREKRIQVIFLGMGLLGVLFILFFQDWVVRFPIAFRRIRLGFMIYTAFFIGFVLSAQLSIVNILGFIQTFAAGFTWQTLMLDPAIFMLWGFLAVSLLLWGRGVYCGWLCPFGALQELAHNLAVFLRLPTFEFPSFLHERLWAIKYLILIALVGVSLGSFPTAARIAEVEPFKTMFSFHFLRSWGFSLYALGLLIVSAFNSKFFCKYLCVLGASLSIMGRFRIFDWLRRHPDCGSPCQACAVRCQISAINEHGKIIDAECHHCLECQVMYSDPTICPPLVKSRKRQESRAFKTAQRIRSVNIE